ncbi:MAG: hypothetical protein HY924_13570 [Elusimicrobia bacterium]|nr:hypothetical protein [Elusimicrobiota bacterium]
MSRVFKALAEPANLLPLFSLALLAAAYLPALSAPFVWDDLGWILFNQALEAPLGLSAYLSDDYFRLSGETSWRPLATAVYNGLTLLAGKEPWAFRLSSLLLHLLTAGLLYRLLLGSGFQKAAAGLACGLFLIHPAHAETLMCAAFNEELLVAVSVLAMLLFHRQGRRLWAAGCLALGLLAKETALAGLALVLLDSWSREGKAGLKRCLAPAAVYAGAALLVLWFALFKLSAPLSSAKAAVPGLDRLVFGLESLVTFVRVQVLPVGLRIEYFALPASSLDTAWLALFAALLLVAAARLMKQLWQAPELKPLALFLAWPFIFWLSFSGAVPAGVLSTRMMAERWLYLPLMGSCALAGWSLQRRPKLAAAVLAVLATLMLGRVRDWTDERRLWSSLVRQYPWCAKAQQGLGDAQVRCKDHSAGLASYEEALRLREGRLDPVLSYYVPISGGHLDWQSPSLRRSLGAGLIRQGELHKARTHLVKAVELDPSDPYAYRLLSYASCLRSEFKEGLEWAEKGLAQSPEDDILLRLAEASKKKSLDFRLKLD